MAQIRLHNYDVSVSAIVLSRDDDRAWQIAISRVARGIDPNDAKMAISTDILDYVGIEQSGRYKISYVVTGVSERV